MATGFLELTRVITKLTGLSVGISGLPIGVRIGAAAFVVGLSLAGPQTLSVASANSSEVDSAAVTTGPAIFNINVLSLYY